MLVTQLTKIAKLLLKYLFKMAKLRAKLCQHNWSI
jgi:hypothetical protein